MHARVVAVTALAVIAGCYEAPAAPSACAIACTDSCPGDLSCVNGFCVKDGEVCAPALQHVSAGAGYACAIDELGRRWCWGSNARHQIDASERAVFELPTRIGTATWDALATGGHTCGIADGRLVCWGANDRGQISGAVAGDVAAPLEIRALDEPARWTSVTAGYNTTCAIGDGRLFCWGAGDTGLLGNGGVADAGVPTPVMTDLADWTAVAIGWGHDGGRNGTGHACAISASAGLWCWGSNSYGELGDGTQIASSAPVHIALPAAPTSVAAGAYSTCATTEGGELYCWGYAGNGALGDPVVIPPSGNKLAPALASGLPGWTQVASGEQWACGLRGDDVWCWGVPTGGAGVGNGIWSRSRGWGRVTGGATELAVGISTNVDNVGVNAADLDLACIVVQGEVRCWGDNRYGQLGQGAAAQAAEPVEVVGGHTWTALAAGGSHVCGLEGGDVLCWGSTTSGQANGVAAGTSNAPCGAFAGLACDVLAPTPLRLAGPVRELAPGTNHTCALGDALACWGDDGQGQLGAGSLPPAPVEVPGAWEALLAVRGNAQCAIQGGQTYCWGSTGAAASQAPTHIVELDGARIVNASATIGAGLLGHACYLDKNRELFCVGDNTKGQFGNGMVTGLSCGNGVCDAGETSATCADCGAPPMTRLRRTYSAISVAWLTQNGAFTCGLRDDGKIECWGRNRGAVITPAIDPGTGQPVDYVYTPTVIGGLSSCTSISAGDAYACAFCDGGLWCWGDHRRGAVGAGPITAVPVSAPRRIDTALPEGDAWAELATGVGFACARTALGRAYCWGSNIHGAIGTGVGAANVPTPLRFAR